MVDPKPAPKSSVKRWHGNRHAFTLIELIFAIVFISISILTVPLMIEVNNDSLKRNLAGEAIFLASSVISAGSATAWDDNSIESTGSANVYVTAKILDVNDLGSGSSYARVSTTQPIRVGGLAQDKHRKFYDYNLSKAASAQPKPSQNGDEPLGLAIDASAASVTGYKSAYTVSSKRVYVTDSGSVLYTTSLGGTISNMKMIEVSISDADGIVSTLRTYTANIGEAGFAKRRMQ